jgi:hypothetical protein
MGIAYSVVFRSRRVDLCMHLGRHFDIASCCFTLHPQVKLL